MNIKTSNLSKNKIMTYIILILFIIIICPLVVEHLIFRNEMYSVISNSDWSSFLGSYIGGVIGGIGTLSAVLISTTHTSNIQEDTNLHNEFYRRKVFTDDIAKLVSEYVTDISSYFYNHRYEEENRAKEERLMTKINGLKTKLSQFEKKTVSIIDDVTSSDNEVQSLKNELEDTKSQLNQVKREQDSIVIDRRKAVQCYFLLKIKLKEIHEANELLNILERIHDNSSNRTFSINWIGNEVDILTYETTNFINQYTNK